MNNELYSYHIFLFPFKWKGKEQSLEGFESALISECWNTSEKFQIKTLEDYNEFNYFFDFTREVMYDLSDDLKGTNVEHSHSIIRHYEYRLGENPTYTINNKYVLKIESILLNVYDTGVAVLSFHLANFKEKEVADILAINQYGRRLFIPSFGYDLKEIGKEIGEKSKHKNFEAAVKLLVANTISLNVDKKESAWDESFLVDTIHHSFQKEPFVIPAFIKNLFGTKKDNLRPSYNTAFVESGMVDIYPVLDDRMFVICWYGNNHLSKSLTQSEFWNEDVTFNIEKIPYPNSSNEIDKAKNNEIENNNTANKNFIDDLKLLYELIYIDTQGDTSCQNKKMLLKHLRNNTYLRWSDYNSFFGMSRFSFVLLTNELPSLRIYNSSYLVKHIQGIYYKMIELCLVQRASVLRFSDEVTEVTEEIKRNKDKEEISEKISNLYKDYIRFVNKIYFREITAQEQGIELYDMLHKAMRINEQVKDLDEEIEELHSYASSQEEKGLSRVASQFLPASFLAALMAIISDKHDLINWEFKIEEWDWGIIFFCTLLMALTLWALFSFKSIFKILNIKLWKVFIKK